MSVIGWNCQGLGLPRKIQFLKDVIRQEKPEFIFLSETISSRQRMEWVCNNIGYEGLITVEPIGRSGGLALMWKEASQAELLSFSVNHIDVVTKVNGMADWRLTWVYGEPNRSKRKKTWDLLKNLARDSNLPWALIGDFNNISSQNEKKGGDNYPTWLVDGFNRTLSETGLQDMEIVGHQYTWEKGRGTNAWMEVRLDRALTNEDWLKLFPLAKLYNTEGAPSDHSLIVLVPKRVDVVAAKRRFKFENACCVNHCVVSWFRIRGRTNMNRM